MFFFYLLPVHLLIIKAQRRKPDELAQCSHYIKVHVVSLGFKARIECGCGCDEWKGGVEVGGGGWVARSSVLKEGSAPIFRILIFTKSVINLFISLLVIDEFRI